MNNKALLNNTIPVLARVTSAGCLFAIFIVTTYKFKPDDAATVLIFQVWSNIASAVIQFGLPIVALRLAKYPTKSPLGMFYRCISIYVIPLLIWPAVIVIACVFSWAYGVVSSTHLLLFSLMTIGHSFCQINADLHRAIDNNRISSAITLAPTATSILLALTFYSDLTPTGLIALLACTHIFVGALGTITYGLINKRFSHLIRPNVLGKYIVTTTRRALSAFSTSILATLSAQIDQALISQLVSPYAFAQYATAARLAQALNVLINSLNPIATTHILRISAVSGLGSAQKFLRRYTFALSVSTVLVLIPILLNSTYIIQLLRKNLESFSLTPTVFLVVPVLFNLVTGPKGYLLWILGHEVPVKNLLISSCLLISLASSSVYFTRDISVTASLVGGALLLQFVVEIILLKRILKISTF